MSGTSCAPLYLLFLCIIEGWLWRADDGCAALLFSILLPRGERCVRSAFAVGLCHHHNPAGECTSTSQTKRQRTTLALLDAMIKLTRSMKTEKLFSPTFRPFTIIRPLTCECPKKGCHINISVNGVVVVNARLNIQRIGNIFGKTDFANVTALELKRHHGNINRSDSFWNMWYGRRRDEQG